MAYAQNTKVPVERSRAEVERVLVKFGANKFFSGWDDRVLSIGFAARNRTIRMTVAKVPPLLLGDGR